jgi:hypothetical protein
MSHTSPNVPNRNRARCHCYTSRGTRPHVVSDRSPTLSTMDTTPPLPQLIRLRDVAKLYGVVPRSVERWIEQGRFLPPLRDPGGSGRETHHPARQQSETGWEPVDVKAVMGRWSCAVLPAVGSRLLARERHGIVLVQLRHAPGGPPCRSTRGLVTAAPRPTFPVRTASRLAGTSRSSRSVSSGVPRRSARSAAPGTAPVGSGCAPRRLQG